LNSSQFAQEQEKAAQVLRSAKSLDLKSIDPCSMAGGVPSRPYRPSIRERVDMALSETNRAHDRGNIAAEIGFLLDRNPEIARLLELLEKF
jgi:hypothetical protein